MRMDLMHFLLRRHVLMQRQEANVIGYKSESFRCAIVLYSLLLVSCYADFNLAVFDHLNQSLIRRFST